MPLVPTRLITARLILALAAASGTSATTRLFPAAPAIILSPMPPAPFGSERAIVILSGAERTTGLGCGSTALMWPERRVTACDQMAQVTGRFLSIVDFMR